MRRLPLAALLIVLLASCTAESTTTLTEGAATASTPAGCPFFDDTLVPDLEDGIDAVLAGAAHIETDDPCVRRFEASGEWLELRFQAAGDDTGLFGDENLMTNGVDTTRAFLRDGRQVDVVASASSPQSISTWDASLVGASVLFAGS